MTADLQRLEELYGKATPEFFLLQDKTIYALADVPGRFLKGKPAQSNRFYATGYVDNRLGGDDEAEATMQLLAELKNHFPSLLARIRELEQERDSLEALFNKATWYTADGLWAGNTLHERVQMAVEVCRETEDEESAALKLIDAQSQLAAAEARAAAMQGENVRFRNGFDNLLQAFREAPGLPLETLSQDDLAKWTDTLTGILKALGPYESTGKPITIFEAMTESAKEE